MRMLMKGLVSLLQNPPKRYGPSIRRPLREAELAEGQSTRQCRVWQDTPPHMSSQSRNVRYSAKVKMSSCLRFGWMRNFLHGCSGGGRQGFLAVVFRSPSGGQGSAGVRPERPLAGCTAEGCAVSAARPFGLAASAGIPASDKLRGSGGCVRDVLV